MLQFLTTILTTRPLPPEAGACTAPRLSSRLRTHYSSDFSGLEKASNEDTAPEGLQTPGVSHQGMAAIPPAPVLLWPSPFCPSY